MDHRDGGTVNAVARTEAWCPPSLPTLGQQHKVANQRYEPAAGPEAVPTAHSIGILPRWSAAAPIGEPLAKARLRHGERLVERACDALCDLTGHVVVPVEAVDQAWGPTAAEGSGARL